MGTWPDTNKNCPALIAWEYGPSAFGADSVDTADCMSGGFGDFVRAQAAGADADAADAAVDHRPHHLEIRLEAAGAYIVRVADRAPHDRLLAADFAYLGH